MLLAIHVPNSKSSMHIYSHSMFLHSNSLTYFYKAFWLVSRYEVCSTHLQAAIAARYFSLQLGLPTMTHLGETPGMSTLLPQAPQQYIAEYEIRSCGLMEDKKEL